MFDTSVDTMNKRLRAYAKYGLPVYQNSESQYQFDPSYKSVRLTRDEIAYELAYAAISDNPKTARRMLKKSVENDPGDMPSDYLLHIEYADVLETECRAKSDNGRCEDPTTGKKMLHHYQRAQSFTT